MVSILDTLFGVSLSKNAQIKKDGRQKPKPKMASKKLSRIPAAMGHGT